MLNRDDFMVRYLERDDPMYGWMDAKGTPNEAGWYYGEVDELDGPFTGDTFGPFPTEAEAEADLGDHLINGAPA